MCEVLRLMKSNDLNYDDRGMMMVLVVKLIIVIHVVENFCLLENDDLELCFIA